MADHHLRVRFENIAPDGGDAPITGRYRKLDWGDNSYAIDDDLYGAGNSGYNNVIHDGQAAGFGAFEQAIEFGTRDGTDFSFARFFAAAAWNNDLQVTVLGFRDGVEVARAEFELDVVQSKIRLADYDADFAAVDFVSIDGTGGTNAGLAGFGEHVTVDNLVLDFLV